ncbi:MAG: hypothetical protein WC645_04295 [Candidatus Margulisiibacteriota bacterium]
MTIMIGLLILTVLAGLWATMTALLLRAAIGLALVSALLSIIMYRMNAPLAAVFELSVCAGLISVVFISTISLTHRLPLQEFKVRRQSRITRFRYLPLVLVLAALGLYIMYRPFHIPLVPKEMVNDVRLVLWETRRIDLFGQILVLLAGVFGVLMLFKARSKDGN